VADAHSATAPPTWPSTLHLSILVNKHSTESCPVLPFTTLCHVDRSLLPCLSRICRLERVAHCKNEQISSQYVSHLCPTTARHVASGFIVFTVYTLILQTNLFSSLKPSLVSPWVLTATFEVQKGEMIHNIELKRVSSGAERAQPITSAGNYCDFPNGYRLHAPLCFFLVQLKNMPCLLGSS
jgi:hypothetical protein